MTSYGGATTEAYTLTTKVGRLIKKIQQGRAIGNKDSMAVVGILSTQLWHHLFIENYGKPSGAGGSGFGFVP